jgi:hypothetical protein
MAYYRSYLQEQRVELPSLALMDSHAAFVSLSENFRRLEVRDAGV